MEQRTQVSVVQSHTNKYEIIRSERLNKNEEHQCKSYRYCRIKYE